MLAELNFWFHVFVHRYGNLQDDFEKMKSLLKKGCRFVFVVDTVANSTTNDSDFKVSSSVKTKEGYDLILKNKNYYDEDTQTQFLTSTYELYDGTMLLQ